MKVSIIRKLAVLLIFFAPVVSYTGCKKQDKCGCDKKDVLFTLTNARAHVYWTTPSNIYFQLVSDPYSTYYFCNPTEMYNSKMTDYKSGDELLVSGPCYWECNYLYQAGNSSYGAFYKAYMVDVTNVYMDLYGKK